MADATPSGFRIATVGVATFSVSLVAALWAVLVCFGYFTRQRWLAVCGSCLLIAVIAVFAAAPRLSAAVVVSTFSAATSMFDINVAVTATVLVVAAVFAACAVGLSDLQRSRAAKIVD